MVLNLAFIVPLKHMGPPLATAIASSVNVALLYRSLTARGHFVADARLKRRIWRLGIAALAMGVALYFAGALFQPYVTGPSLERWGSMAVLVTLGGIVYAVAAVATGAFRLGDIRQLIRRPTKAK